MLVSKFEEICELRGFFFDYGPLEWQNLNDFEDDTDEAAQDVKLLLLFVDRELNFDDLGGVESAIYTGGFLLVVRSKFDQTDYLDKYKNRIRQVRAHSDAVHTDFGICTDWIVLRWKETEMVDGLDTNVDGLKVQFTIRLQL